MDNTQRGRQKYAEQVGGVFFIGSGKTYHFSLSFKSYSFLVGVLFLSLSWAIMSLFLLSKLMSKDYARKEQIFDLKTALFAFESKYEKLFDKVYDKKAEHLSFETPSKTSLSREKKLSALKLFEEKRVTQSSVGKDWSENMKAFVKDHRELSNKVEVKEMAVRVKDNRVEVSFELHNRSNSRRVEGHMWGVVLFKGPDGKASLVGIPRNLDFDERTWLPAELHHAYKYSLSRFSRPKLVSSLETKGTKGKSMESILLMAASKKGEVIYKRLLFLKPQT